MKNTIKIIVFLFLLLVCISASACSMDSIPVLTVDIYVEENQYLELERSLIDFGRLQGFSATDNGRVSSLNDGRKVLSVDFRREDRIEMALGDYMNGQRYWVSIYDDNQSGKADALSVELLNFLRSNWPNMEIVHQKKYK